MKADQKKNKKSSKGTTEPMKDKKLKVSASNGDSLKNKKKVQQSSGKKSYDKKSKKQAEKSNIFKISAQFLRDARNELNKVKWPTRKELIASTTMVVILVLIVALYLGIVDFGLMNIINRIV